MDPHYLVALAPFIRGVDQKQERNTRQYCRGPLRAYTYIPSVAIVIIMYLISEDDTAHFSGLYVVALGRLLSDRTEIKGGSLQLHLTLPSTSHHWVPVMGMHSKGLLQQSVRLPNTPHDNQGYQLWTTRASSEIHPLFLSGMDVTTC